MKLLGLSLMANGYLFDMAMTQRQKIKNLEKKCTLLNEQALILSRIIDEMDDYLYEEDEDSRDHLVNLVHDHVSFFMVACKAL